MKKITLFLLILPFLGLCQVQIGEDIDGEAAGDSFGSSVSLSSNGNIICIGVARSDDNIAGNFNSGTTLVYKNIEGIWTQIGQNINGENTNDQLGYLVSLSSNGNIFATSSPYEDTNGEDSGYVRVYENIEDVWTQVGQNINGDSEGDNTGFSLSLSSDGSILAIASPSSDGNGNNSGDTSIYINIEGVWVQIGEDINGENSLDFSGSDGLPGTNGISLSSDGTIVAIGAIYNDGNGDSSGHVRIYENIGGLWTKIGQDIDGEFGNDKSGNSVSLSSNGTIVAIGATGNAANGIASGHVRIYKNVEGLWIQVGQDIDGEDEGDNSGRAVRISSDGSIVAIGAPGNDQNGSFSGHVRIYKNIEEVWTQVGHDIDGEGEGQASGFAISLSSDGTIVAIGAAFNTSNGNVAAGHVRVYSIASELALLEVVDDIQGNLNGINVTATQLNSINGVSGAIEGVNYTTALTNGTFVDENNPTAAEIQAIINQVNDTLSVSENELFSLSIYPNPTKNQFTIQLDPSIQLQNVVIYNTLGQVVLTSEENIINTSKLSSGSYIVEILTNKGKSSKKLIVE